MKPDMNRRVIVVDDDERILTSFQKILTPPRGRTARLRSLVGELSPPPVRFELTTATQGKKAAVQVQAAVRSQQPFAVAFVDMRMPPGWDGVETIRRIRALDPEVYVVVVTAFADHSEEEMRQAVQHELILLRKPFQPTEITNLAERLCKRWTERAAPSASKGKSK